VTGEGNAAAEPAQVKNTSSLEAPKPTNLPTNLPTNVPTYQGPANDESFSGAIAAADTPAAIEMIEPSTGEIIVLAQHKPATPVKAAAEVQVTPLAKPEKRKNAKEKANGKLKTKPAEDGTTPTTATAMSNAGAKTGAKSAEVLAANEARKERKAAAKAKAGTKAGPKATKKAAR
jgi:hypothetical protein